MNSTLTINSSQASVCQRSYIHLSKILTSLRQRICQEPSIIPITVGTSSVGGAILTSLWNSTRSLTPWLGIIGTICVAVGIHLTGNTNPIDNE